ncbi:hypothetical protein TUMSATVNIG1_21310 [Vibrio nigripulchritudo]|uniref:hypothetical protein n=1 Tax=Vibrio nigripulchritudo TaxID=28173 RepID=UPI001909BF51|nr:hypothetical protein [Vibrio nigripulchritudo]BCL70172.1 hypothetical protein VNTUMSATTG_21090 [Vibrio nigripulchritudo]BDU31522.1 hypothetical protein TUMSATVNIG1_21310 [Vibrio nigripulchritudo]
MKFKIITVASVVMLIAACSGPQAYYGTRSSQQNQCQSIADKLEYEQCMQDSKMSYEEYQERLKN